MRSHLFFILISISTLSFGQKAAADNYNEGLRLVEAKHAKEAFLKFYASARYAKEGSELQLRAIFKAAHYYNYSDEKSKPEVLKLTLKGLYTVRKTSRNDTLAAFIFYRAGRAYELNYQADSALLVYEEARKRLEVFFGSRSVHVGECIWLMGQVKETVLYDYTEAEALYEKALTIMEQLPPDELTTYYTSLLYSTLSSVNRKQKDFEKALAYSLKNVAFAESIAYPVYQEKSYAKVAQCYRDMNLYDSAKKYFARAISKNKTINNGKANSLLANHFFELGIIFEKQGWTDQAIQNYTLASTIFSKTSFLKDIGHIQCLEKLGNAFYKKGFYDKSFQAFQKGLVLIRQYDLGKSGQAASLYKSLGNYFKSKHQPDSALLLYQKSLFASSHKFASINSMNNPLIEQIYLKDHCFETLIQKALLLTEMFHASGEIKYANTALQSFRLAEELLTISRNELDMDDSKWNFLDANFDLYNQAVSLIQLLPPSKEWIENAFLFIEASKAKSLSDAIRNAEFNDQNFATDSLLQFLAAQKKNMHQIQNQILKFSDSARTRSVEIQKLRNALVNTDRKIQLTEQLINQKYPSYLTAKFQTKLPTLENLIDYSKTNNSCIIQYFWGTEEVFGFGIFKDQILFKRIGLSDSLKKEVEKLHGFLTASATSLSQEAFEKFSSNAYFLYLKLVQPFEVIYPQTKQLIIIPDGPLAMLPFEVLTTSNKGNSYQQLPYLIKTHNISYSFSSAYLLKPSSEFSKENQLIAFAFTDSRTVSDGGSKFNLSSLKGSSDEYEHLKSRFVDGKFLKGSEVTEENFKRMASDYDLLHLSVHGQVDVNKDYSSALFFYADSSSKEDGKLYWYELSGMHLKARLAVISSCESGIGKTYRGEGMLSMASAFAFAGCDNIVMGMWKVDDRVSAILMDKFYENIMEGVILNEALAGSKRKYLSEADEFSAHPRLWASLVAYGDQKIIYKSKYKVFFLVVGLILIMGIVFLRKKIKRQIKSFLT
jgi:CHAT domain-containing protein